MHILIWSVCFTFKAGSLVILASLKLIMQLVENDREILIPTPISPEHWDYGHVPIPTVYALLGTEPGNLYIWGKLSCVPRPVP